MTAPGDSPLLCHRCGCDLTPGKGGWYVVRIEAFADPTPAPINEEDLGRDIGGELDMLIQSMQGMSEQELMDSIYRRLTITLCASCYRGWIEDPASGS